MAVGTEHTLHWSSAAGDNATMLEQLQPNILKGHVRDHLSVLFLHFDVQAEGRAFLRAVRGMMKSAKKHLEEARQFKLDGTDGTPYVGVGLTAAGYTALGVAPVPPDPQFLQPGGMKGSRTSLRDPVVSTWDPAYQGEIHAVVLVGDAQNRQQRYETTRHAVLGLLTDGITVLGEELGRSLVNANGHGIEHFGYVDGRSQPLFLDEDIKDETDEQDGTDNWDPAFALSQVIVEDPAAPNPSTHFGSYFVFRKLEQNVALFKQGEDDLADRLDLIGPDRERAGAMLVGRFEDGTPLTLQNDAGSHEPVMNNFDYGSDEDGSKCPFHAHIRKANPRGFGGAPGVSATDIPFERSHIMARRGQTYGQRSDDPGADLPLSARPTRGVGLLFWPSTPTSTRSSSSPRRRG